MPKSSINFTFNRGATRKFINRVDKESNQALARALNGMSKSQLVKAAKEIREDTKIPTGEVKRSIKVKKATRNRLYFEWGVSGKRLRLIKPKLLGATKGKRSVKGISFLGDNRKRKKILGRSTGKSKPFLIDVKDGGKTTPLAVYTRTDVPSKQRKPIRFAWHSVPRLLRDDWRGEVLRYLSANLKRKFREELAKSRFIRQR